MKNTISKLISKLRNPEYRKAYVASQITVGIPFQIKALLKGRDWTQTELGERANMVQPFISRLLNPGEEEPNIRTLRRIAEAFDCGLMVRFVPFSELVLRSERFDPESFTVPAFEQEFSGGRFQQLESHLVNGGVPISIGNTNEKTHFLQRSTANRSLVEKLPPMREYISLHDGGRTNAAGK